MSRKGRKRLSVDMPIYMHEKIKELAKRRNCTITHWVLRAASSKIKKECQYDN